MVENERVSGAMKDIGCCLDRTTTCGNGQTRSTECGPDELKDKSLTLASTLEQAMLTNWNKKPEEFTKGQFVYGQQ